MQQQRSGMGTMDRSPVDNETYNLLQTLTSKLEALDVYQRYERDSQGETATLFQEIAEDRTGARHACHNPPVDRGGERGADRVPGRECLRRHRLRPDSR